MPYTPIIGALGYILSPDGKQVLMVHRTRDDDYHNGKYNGLGGKMEPGEDILHCLKREIHEEAGIECGDIEMRGTVNWTSFGPNGEDWLGFIFVVKTFTGTPQDHSPEGPLEWVNITEMSKLPMWEGDRHFLPLVFDGDPRPFHGYMPYEGNSPKSWSYTRV